MKKLLISLALLLNSASSFAETYHGHKNFSDSDSKDCTVTVSKLNDDKMELEVSALGHRVESMISPTDESFTIEKKSKGSSKEDIKVTGSLKDGVPVSIQMNTVEKVLMDDSTVSITDSVSCVFDQKSTKQ
ncbi:MAG: hypothetical protein ACXVCP_04395 [Bdellovibrio sp.]